MKRPKMVTFLLVYVGLLTCFALENVTAFLYQNEGLSGLVAAPLALLGAIVTQQIWIGMEKQGCVSIIGASVMCGVLTSAPVFLAFIFLESAGGLGSVSDVGSIENFAGSILIGIAIWVVIVGTKVTAMTAWRYFSRDSQKNQIS